jgi:hypothetical protein
VRDRAGWRAAVWVLGTAGIYSALYGFAAGERTPAVLGVALAVVAVVGGPLTAALHSSSPRRPSWVSARPAADAADPGPTTPSWESRPATDADPGYGYNDPAFDGTDDSSYYPSPRLVPLEDEPSRHTDRFLFPTERFRGEWRRHWVRPLVRYAVTLGLAVGAQFLIPRFVPAAHVHAARTGVAVAGGLIALHVLFAWEVGRLVLTNRRVMLVEGVIRRRVSTAPLPRAGDLRLECSLAGRLFHYGDFVFERKSVFSRMRMVAALPRPNELYLRVVEEVYEPAAVEERFNLDRELEDL